MKLPEVSKLNKKINWAIIIPIIAVVVVIIVLLFADYQRRENVPNNNNNNNQSSMSEEYRPQPISAKDNPRRKEALTNTSKYGCASPATIAPLTTKNPDVLWRVPKDGSSNIVSLGKYKIINPANTVLDIPTLWLYFLSEKLSNRSDKLYSLESSYIKSMKIIVNGYEKEIKLGGSEYMFIELSDYPLGDIYPYDKKTVLEFEVLIELKCNNFKDGVCLDNEMKPLKFSNDTNIESQFRIFAVGCEDFTQDIIAESKLILE